MGKLSADLTNLLKNHIKKKGKTIPAKGNGKEAATPKPSPIANQRTDSLSKESQENQENQKQIVNSSNVPLSPSAPSQYPGKDQTLLDVEPSKACSELDAVPAVLDYSATKALQTPNELSVLESRPDNVLNQQNMVPKIAPAPAKPPAAPSPVAGGQTSGVKKIQKVHKLTDETKLLLMNSFKKGKAKASAKTASAKSSVTVAAPSQTVVESVSVLPSVPPVVLKKATPTKDECKVNIISSVVLPRLFNVPGQSGQPIPNVSSFGTTHQHSYTFPDSSAVISIPSASSSLAVTQSLGQPGGRSKRKEMCENRRRKITGAYKLLGVSKAFAMVRRFCVLELKLDCSFFVFVLYLQTCLTVRKVTLLTARRSEEPRGNSIFSAVRRVWYLIAFRSSDRIVRSWHNWLAFSRNAHPLAAAS